MSLKVNEIHNFVAIFPHTWKVLSIRVGIYLFDYHCPEHYGTEYVFGVAIIASI